MSDLLPLGIAAALVVNSYLHRRLVVAAQPLRLELAERGEALLRNQSLPPRVRASVEFIVTHAFGMTGLLFVSVIAIPVAVPIMVMSGEMDREAQAEASMSAKLRAEYNQLVALHSRIIFATHPGLVTITVLEILLIAGPLVLLSGALSGKLLPEVTQTSILQAIEFEASTLGRRRAEA